MGWRRNDEDNDPSLVFILSKPRDRIVAIAHCWLASFIQDLVLARARRRHGIAEALLLRVFAERRSRGLRSCDLKVMLNDQTAPNVSRDDCAGKPLDGLKPTAIAVESLGANRARGA